MLLDLRSQDLLLQSLNATAMGRASAVSKLPHPSREEMRVLGGSSLQGWAVSWRLRTPVTRFTEVADK